MMQLQQLTHMSRPLAALLAMMISAGAWGQQTYSSGQYIEPAYEGWEQLEDGSYNFLFGYHNENWEREQDIPVGADNFFSPGDADRGQPTHFQPRRNRFTFKVNVPEDWGDRELVWTVTSNGETRKAYATLARDYVVDKVVIASETGSLGAGTSTPESRANTPPELAVLGDHGDGEAVRYAFAGEAITLSARVRDDGLPGPLRARGERTPSSELGRVMRAPTRITVGKHNGLFLSWSMYRGPGRVEFDPPQVKTWEDTRAAANSPWGALWTPPPVPENGLYTVDATFGKPGTYVLWARADDGGLYQDRYVTVYVIE